MIDLPSLNPKNHTLDETQINNIIVLCDKLQQLEFEYGENLTVNRGYSTKEEQLKIDPKHPNSRHCTCEAVDLADTDKKLYSWCIENLDFMIGLHLYIEDGSHTPHHVHLQTVAPKSGNHVFIP